MKITSFDDLDRELGAISKMAKQKDVNVDEVNRLLAEYERAWNEFLKELAEARQTDEYDYLELADRALSKKKKREYLEKVREIAPNALDVLHELYFLDAPEDPEVRLKIYEKLLKKGREDLESVGLYEECTGHFWDILETRSYMRVMASYKGRAP